MSGTTGIRIHKRIVVSTVRRAGGRRRGSRVTAGIASGGRVRRRGGLSGTGYTVRAVTRISGRKSRVLDIPATVRGVAGVACGVGGVAACVCGVAGVACGVGGVSACVCGVAGATSRVSGVPACVCGVAGVACCVGSVAACVRGVAGVACGVGSVSACVRGVAGATSRIGGTADTMGTTTCTVRGMARTAGEATATGCGVSCTARTAGDTAAASSGVRGVAGATSRIGCPADCVRGVAGIPEGPTRPRCAAHVTDPIQGASHAVGGVTQVVGVVGCSGQVLCGVRQLRDVRRGIQTVGAELTDHVLAELSQRTNIVGVNRQDRLNDLFADAKSASRTSQGLLTGRHASTTAHGHNRHDHVGQEVANGARGIIGPRIPVQQRLTDALHETDGIVPQRLRHADDRFGGDFVVLDDVLIPGHVAHEDAAEVHPSLAAAQLPQQLRQIDNGLDSADHNRSERALDRIPPRALGQLRDTRIQGGNQQVAGLVNLVDQRLEISFCRGHLRAARTLITRGIKHGRATISGGLAARISLIILRLLDRVTALLPTRTNPITLALRRRQRRRIRRVRLGGRRERLLGIHPALNLHLELRAEMISRAALPPISTEGRQTGMNIPELVGASHHHRGTRRNTTRIPTDLKNRCTMRNNTHVRSRPRTNDGRLPQRVRSLLNLSHVLFSLLHVLAISAQSATDRTGGSLDLITQVVRSLFPRVLERVRAIPHVRILQHPRVGNPVLHVVLLGRLLKRGQ